MSECRAGCRLWLKAAKAHPASRDRLGGTRVHALVRADQYGARDELLRCSDSLFDQPALRRARRAVRGRSVPRDAARETNHDTADYSRYAASAAMPAGRCASGSADLSTKAVLSYSPDPNPLQKAQFADRYLRFGRAQEALRVARRAMGVSRGPASAVSPGPTKPSGTPSGSPILAGDYSRPRDPRRTFRVPRMFTRLRSGKRQTPRRADRAQATDYVIGAAHLLLAIEDDRGAERLLVDRRASIRGESYYHLLPIAETLESRGRLCRALSPAIGRSWMRSSHGPMSRRTPTGRVTWRSSAHLR